MKKTSGPIYAFCLTYLVVTCFIPAQGGEFGRLFLTNKERTILEKTRLEKTPVDTSIKEFSTNSSLPEVSGTTDKNTLAVLFTLKGVVKRSHGKSIAWLNRGGMPAEEFALQKVEISGENISDGSIKFRLPNKSTKLDLKVGQTYQLEKEITE